MWSIVHELNRGSRVLTSFDSCWQWGCSQWRGIKCRWSKVENLNVNMSLILCLEVLVFWFHSTVPLFHNNQTRAARVLAYSCMDSSRLLHFINLSVWSVLSMMCEHGSDAYCGKAVCCAKIDYILRDPECIWFVNCLIAFTKQKPSLWLLDHFEALIWVSSGGLFGHTVMIK